ncbi:IS3 family transposase [Nocardioides hungaricus]
MLTDLIAQIHTECHGIYGARRVHAELTIGRGILVGHGQVELLMQRAGLQGISGRKKWRRIRPDTIATDLVERDFNRNGPNQLWVTDIKCRCRHLMSATHSSFGAVATNFRSTRSSGRSVSAPSPMVVLRVFSRGIPRRPSARINRSTVQRATGMPSRLSSAWIFLAP